MFVCIFVYICIRVRTSTYMCIGQHQKMKINEIKKLLKREKRDCCTVAPESKLVRKKNAMHSGV